MAPADCPLVEQGHGLSGLLVQGGVMPDTPISAERLQYLRRRMRDKLGWTDAELDQLGPRQWRRIDVTSKIERYKVVAEVVWAHHCELSPKPGDKYVSRGGMLLPAESTFPGICVGALARIYPVIQSGWELMVAGRDPNDMFIDHVKCIDVGPENGGLGEVLFKIYCLPA